MRPMLLDFFDDETCHYLDRQYMFGDSLLVAPIFNDQGRVRYYVPKGEWTNILTQEKVAGGNWHSEEHDYLTLPLLAKENSIIVFGNNDQTAEYDYRSKPSFHVFELKNTKSVIYDLSGKETGEITGQKAGNMLVFNVEGINGTFEIVLRNVPNVESVEGGSIEKSEFGVKITSEEKTIRVKLENGG